jgi:hypothetical protein
MRNKNTCTVHSDGWHVMVDQGRDESLFAHVYLCACGEEQIGQTDEFEARMVAKETHRE